MTVLAAREFDDDQGVPGFVSVDEVPDELLDEHPAIEDEGDDSIHAPDGGRGVVGARRLASLLTGPLPPKSRARIVPFRRPIHRGMRGKDVLATKRALSHAGYLRWPKRWTLLAGPFWIAAVKKFQKQHGLDATGVYNLATHRKLVTLGHYDKYGALLMGQAPRGVKDKDVARRDRLEAIALYGYHNRGRIYYTQGPDRMSIVRQRIRFPWFQHARVLGEDCSSFDTGVYYSADEPDPNRNRYNGLGYTGTLAQHGVQAVHIQRGDLAFYGHEPFRHVTMHVGHGSRCVSHGSTIGPLLLSTFRYRSDYHYSRSYI